MPSVDLLLNQLNAPEYETRGDALGSLEDLSGQPFPQEFQPQILSSLHSFVLNADYGNPERQTAAMILGRYAAGAILLELSNSEDPVLREHAAAGFGKYQHESSVTRLIEMLTDPVNKVRNLAERSLIGLQSLVNQVGIEPLLQLLDHPEPLTHSPAARLLGLSQDPRALEPLTEKLKQADKWLTRMWTVKALGDLGQFEAFETLNQVILTDEKNRVRASAAAAIAELKHPQSKEVLESIEGEEDEGVKAAISEALDTLEKSGFDDTTDPFADA